MCRCPPPLLCRSVPMQAASDPHAWPFGAVPDLIEAFARPPAAHSCRHINPEHVDPQTPSLASHDHHISAYVPHGASQAPDLGTSGAPPSAWEVDGFLPKLSDFQDLTFAMNLNLNIAISYCHHCNQGRN